MAAIGIDTNVLVRYIVQDDARQSRAATQFMERTLSAAKPGLINDIVLCELVWVLESGYNYAREQVAQTLRVVFEIDRLRVQNQELAWRALDAYLRGIDFSDALIALINQAAGCDHTVSFDRRAARLETIRLLSH